jgi:hypothetical protein
VYLDTRPTSDMHWIYHYYHSRRRRGRRSTRLTIAKLIILDLLENLASRRRERRMTRGRGGNLARVARGSALIFSRGVDYQLRKSEMRGRSRAGSDGPRGPEPPPPPPPSPPPSPPLKKPEAAQVCRQDGQDDAGAWLLLGSSFPRSSPPSSGPFPLPSCFSWPPARRPHRRASWDLGLPCGRAIVMPYVCRRACLGRREGPSWAWVIDESTRF